MFFLIAFVSVLLLICPLGVSPVKVDFLTLNWEWMGPLLSELCAPKETKALKGLHTRTPLHLFLAWGRQDGASVSLFSLRIFI